MAELENNIDLTKLYDYADELANLYKMEITNADAVASGSLLNFTHRLNWDGSTLKLTFDLPEYWYYIENGRGPTMSSGGGVLINAIREWISRKGITPRDGNKESMAWAITKSIHKEGYFKPGHHGKHPLKNAIDNAENSGLIQKMVESVKDELGKPVKVSLEELGKKR